MSAARAMCAGVLLAACTGRQGFYDGSLEQSWQSGWVMIDGPSEPTTSGMDCGPGVGVYPSPPAASAPVGPLRPGARSSFGMALTADGPVLFGGLGCAVGESVGSNSDMWRRDLANDTWTWLGGAALPDVTVSNWPSFRTNFELLVGGDGKPYMFGGWMGGDPLIEINDMSRYDGGATPWVSISGDTSESGAPPSYVSYQSFDPANLPGARWGPTAWAADDGTLWYYGGAVNATAPVRDGTLRDMWRFSPTLAQWAWMGGDDQTGQLPSVEDSGPDASPGSLTGPTRWVGLDGNLYLFGGGAGELVRTYAALWRYCLSTTSPCSAASQYTWTRIKGTDAGNVNGVYGTVGVPAPENTPGSRGHGTSWRDEAGNLWLFGGRGLPETGSSIGALNDLWRFDGENWAWIGGSKLIDDPAYHGAMAGLPAARFAAVAVSLPDSSVLLYGGSNSQGHFADLWRFRP